MMEQIRSRLVFLVLLFEAIHISGATAQGQKLRVAYTAFASTFTIHWVGKDSGLYQKYGADMNLLYIGSSTKSVQALLGGDIDIVYSAAGALVDTNLAGAELIIVGCQYDNGQTSFVKDYALRIPYVSVAGLTSILEFRAETAAEAKKTRPEKMYDNSLLQEIQKETTK